MTELPSRPEQLEPHAVLAALALVLGVVSEVDEGVVALRGDHDHVAAAAAVAARWAAAGHELFAAEGHAAVAAVAGLDANSCFIDEHGEPVVSGQLSVISCQSAGVRYRPQNAEDVFPVYRNRLRIACNFIFGKMGRRERGLG